MNKVSHHKIIKSRIEQALKWIFIIEKPGPHVIYSLSLKSVLQWNCKSQVQQWKMKLNPISISFDIIFPSHHYVTWWPGPGCLSLLSSNSHTVTAISSPWCLVSPPTPPGDPWPWWPLPPTQQSQTPTHNWSQQWHSSVWNIQFL